MFSCIYSVVKIDGDYAYLQQTDAPEAEPKLVARALLPPEIAEGKKLLYEWLQSSIVE